MRKLILSIGHDYDTEVPSSGYDGWKLVSFGRRHTNYESPENYFNEKGNNLVTLKTGGLHSKRRVGLLFILSYYEHSGSCWSLKGEGPQCQWDNVDLAGLLIWTGKPGDIGAKTKEDRAKDARAFIEEYNEWANGHTYFYNLTTEDGEDVDGCGGVIGSDRLAEMVSEHLEPGDVVKVEGEHAWMGEYLKFPKGVETVEEFDDEEAA